MRQALEDMYALLVEQRAILRELRALSNEKKTVIIQGNTDRLAEITAFEQRLVAKMKNLEKKHTKHLPGLAAALDLPEDGLNISGILAKTQGDEHEAFSCLQRELNGLLAEQRKINKLNATLLETQLDYTENMLSVLIGNEDPLNNFYGIDGLSEDKKRASGFFDQQI